MDASTLDRSMVALHDLRRTRRRKRIAEVDWLDAAYHAYVAGILGTVVVLFLSSLVGDNELTASGIANVREHGPAVIGLVAALALAAGIRSGSRGGPLALEPAEVRFVLLSPVDRTGALRGPVLRQLRFACFVGAVVGAVAGQLAVRRLPGAPLAWIASCAAAGALTAMLFVGAALCSAGWRLPQRIATLLGALVVAWAALDVAEIIPAPTSTIGSIALWPLRTEPIDLLGAIAVVALLFVGLRAIGGVSVEYAERRTSLVGQLRFAVTVQDLRTVIVLRRQLAQDRPRVKPWVRLRHVGRRLPVWRRDWEGVLRFPAARAGRLVLLAAAAGLCVRATWEGTTPLIVVAGLAMFVAATDAFEPLAQQVDQADLSEALPVDTGSLLVRHLAAGTIVMLLVALVAAAVGVLVNPSSTALAIGAVMVVPAALTAASGGVVSIVMGAPAPAPEGNQLLPPEVAGMKIVLRAVWPIVLTMIGLAPIIVARVANDHDAGPVAAAAAVGCIGVLAAWGTGLWVRFREPLHRAWSNLLEQSQAESMARSKARSARAAS
ncbi:MAG TPA: hypothetical protein VK461_15705 [Acidimicrobiales bacterium]|nr:hypothetical protein [Acidimicrobiales bacterium]